MASEPCLQIGNIRKKADELNAEKFAGLVPKAIEVLASGLESQDVSENQMKAALYVLQLAGDFVLTDPAYHVIHFLQSLDPAEVDKMALSSLGLGDAGGSESIINALIHIAQGNS